MKLYSLLGSILRPFGLAALYAYSWVTRTARTRIIVYNEKGELLLLQTWLGGGTWGLPGGGVERGEQPAVAAARELREEAGIVVAPEQLRFVTTLRSAGHDELVFSVTIQSTDLSLAPEDVLEVKAIAWHAAENLPKLGSLTAKVMAHAAVL